MPRARFALLLVPALALGACAGGVDPNDRNQRALGGAALGAGAGALIGSVTGSAGRGALIGGALGGVAGALTPPPASQGYETGGHGYDPRAGGYYDSDGRWIQGVPAGHGQGPYQGGYGGYRPNYR